MSVLFIWLVWLFNMVLYFQVNFWIICVEVVVELGVIVKQLEEDFNQLWMCGFLGYFLGDFIDFEFCGDIIEVMFLVGIDWLLKFILLEVIGLLVVLWVLVDIFGVVDLQVVCSVIVKIVVVVGVVVVVVEQVFIESLVVVVVWVVVWNSWVLIIDYYVVLYDIFIIWIVDFIWVLLIGGYSYLEVWLCEVEGVCLFCFDWIVDVVELGEVVVLLELVWQVLLDMLLFDGDLLLLLVMLWVVLLVLWMLEYYLIWEL